MISVKGARVHNLKDVSLDIPRNKLIVFTGLSGSGKSSLAFDTIYAEGQRRYVESLSAYARQFLEQLDKPDVDSIDGLSPAISIDQKSASHNPRSTVGTVTEVYDYFRLLFANIGKPYCPNCHTPIQKQSPQEILEQIMALPEGTRLLILAPVVQDRKGEFKNLLESFKKQGFSRVRVDGTVMTLSEDITLSKTKKHTIDVVVDRLSVSQDNHSRLFESIETSLKLGEGLVKIDEADHDRSHLFSENFSCPHCQISFAEISPRLFSFNAPVGACPSCNGLGDKYVFDPDLVVEDPDMPVKLATQKCLNLDQTYYGRSVIQTATQYGFKMDTPIKDLTPEQFNVLMYGHPQSDSLDSEFKPVAPFEGVITNLQRRYYQTASEGMRFFFRNFMSPRPCSECQGKRLKKIALSVKIQDHNIADLMDMNIRKLHDLIVTLPLSEKEQTISKQIVKEIRQRLSFLNNVGLDYLSLGRTASTLSGGEYQRIRLATQIGSGLTGVLYVLDEPSIGLHQRDNLRLIETLVKLRDLGNTLIIVEHDEDMIRHADHIVDIGPGAGVNGGKILYSGQLEGLLKTHDSQTAHYLNGTKKIDLPQKRRLGSGLSLSLKGAAENNLKNIDVDFPLGQFICITGVSGSGKSTLINDILHKVMMKHFNRTHERIGQYKSISGLEHIDKVITIDQSPIGRTPRSNPATYTSLFTPIRELFAQTREAKVRGYKAGRFSFNVKGGRCEACEGDGVLKIEMHFLSDVYVTCEVCKAKRYNNETLEVKYKGKSISDVLSITVDEAIPVFENIPAIYSRLKTLQDVGLGYIGLGQNATTLSGGEAQRIKLAKELSKRSTGKTLYLLDEPTTGLHFADIKQLLEVLNRLVNSGNTVIVIEHNLDVIKTADTIIDLGPDGGDKGGTIVAIGTPEKVAKTKASYTGKFLKPLLK